ncbi:hypothetical protein AB0D04_36785 [Streptomyces sp. NPDC048483]|uniref:hypothetical protein n=1 Tax=Streptomyces sp. NPDC048483 TaxID=3154927 RepID=UPI00341CA491
MPTTASGAPVTAHPAQPIRRFPPHPVRDVLIRNVRQNSCPGKFAIVTLDFAPLPDDESAPAVFDWPVRARPEIRRRIRAWPDDQEWLGILERSLEQGVRNALDALPATIRPAVRCTVTELHWHEVDSNEWAFVRAGEMAVAEALRRCGM